jgi:hypothetical protein
VVAKAISLTIPSAPPKPDERAANRVAAIPRVPRVALEAARRVDRAIVAVELPSTGEDSPVDPQHYHNKTRFSLIPE